MNNSITILSLALTVPFLALMIAVIHVYQGTAWAAWRQRKIKQLTATDWLLLGICVGFVGKILDNSYWSIAWLAHLENKDWWLQHGTTFNIFFRILAGSLAAWCHINAAIIHAKAEGRAVFFLRDYAFIIIGTACLVLWIALLAGF